MADIVDLVVFRWACPSCGAMIEDADIGMLKYMARHHLLSCNSLNKPQMVRLGKSLNIQES